AIVALVRAYPRAMLVACAAVSLSAGMLIGSRAERNAIEPTLLTWYRQSAEPQTPVQISGTLRDDAAPTGSAVSVTIDVAQVTLANRVEQVSGGARLSIGGTLAAAGAIDWRAGRHVAVAATLREPLDYRDPGVPSDRLRLARQGIVLLGSIKSAALVQVTARGSWLDELAAAVRGLVRRGSTAAVGP